MAKQSYAWLGGLILRRNHFRVALNINNSTCRPFNSFLQQITAFLLSITSPVNIVSNVTSSRFTSSEMPDELMNVLQQWDGWTGGATSQPTDGPTEWVKEKPTVSLSFADEMRQQNVKTALSIQLFNGNR